MDALLIYKIINWQEKIKKKRQDKVRRSAALLALGCASVTPAPSAPSATTDGLDMAIREASDYLNANVPAGSKIVILNVQSSSDALSDYVIDELMANAVNDRKFELVDRHQLDLIRAEQNFQMSGAVDDREALEIGKFFGAQTIVSGAVTPLGERYRMTIRALEVQSAKVQGHYNRNLDASPTLNVLMKMRGRGTPVQPSGVRLASASGGAGVAGADGGAGGGSVSAGAGDGSGVEAGSGVVDGGSVGASGTSGSAAVTPIQVTQAQSVKPTYPKNGTYTFYPRLQAYYAGRAVNCYLDRIIVRGEYLTFYLTDRAVGEGSDPEGQWWQGSARTGDDRMVLQDLDNPRRTWKYIDRGNVGDTHSTQFWLSYQGVNAKRLTLIWNRNGDVGYVFEEIIIPADPDQ